MADHSDYFAKVAKAVEDSDKEGCLRLLEEGKDIDPLQILEEGLGKGIRKVGDDFGAEIVFLPELIGAADVMKAGVAVLDARIKASGMARQSQGTIVIGTVKGDIHDIGKSVVASMLQANGYDVVDLGIDVADDAFVRAAIENDADCIAMSSLLTLNIEYMGVIVESLKQQGLRDKVKVIVGGAPVTDAYAAQIGADGFAVDASRAAALATSLVG